MIDPAVFAHLDRTYQSQTHKINYFKFLWEQVKHLDGDLAEFGVYNGNGSRELAQLDPSRKVYAFDTFEGIPIEDYHEEEDKNNPPGKWIPLAQPAALFEGIPNIVPVKGRFAHTLLNTSSLRVCLVHIDCDLYESYRQVLEWLEGHMVPGGIALIDDYPGCVGAKRAVDEWVTTHQALATFHPNDKICWHKQ